MATTVHSHVFHIADDTADQAAKDRDFRTAMQIFYKEMGDDYDFLYIVHRHAGSYQYFRLDTTTMLTSSGMGPEFMKKNERDEWGRVATGYSGAGNPAEGDPGDGRFGLREPTPTKLRGYATFHGNAKHGPTLHETAHEWGNFFRRSEKLSREYPHWGYTSVNGSLGGFDATTLKDVKRGGGELKESGATRVSLAPFSTNSSNDGKPYGMFELYLMGLADKSEVKDLIVLDVAPETTQDSNGELDIEGWSKITMSDLITQFGEATRLNNPTFRGAFILITEGSNTEPTDLIGSVTTWAKVFSGEESDPDYLSFAAATLNRASMRTDLTR